MCGMYDSPSLGVPGSTTLTVNASSTTPVGTYPLTISGSDGTLTHTTAATLTVAAPDFTVAVAPGSTLTPALEASARLYGIDVAEFAKQQPVGRLLEPDEVAAAIAWLAGPDSSGMTGAVVSVDGGLSV